MKRPKDPPTEAPAGDGRRDRGCYAKKHEPCVGYLGSGCRNCGRIITLELIERGDARGG